MVTTLFEFDRAQTRVERWLNISLISLAFVAIGAILYTIPIAWLPAVSSNSSILAIGFLIIGILIAWFFFRRGHQALAAGAIIATLFAIPTYLNFVVYQTIHSPDIWLYFIIIPLTGLLLGRKHMSYFTLLCLLSATALFFLEYYGFVTPTFTVYTNVNDFAILVVSLSLNTVLLYIIIRRAEDKTAEAQRSLQTLLTTHHQLAESRQALQHAHAQLELRVQERTQELQVANRSLQNEVAARQNLMDALRHSEANWRSLVQNAPELIATLTIDGTILFVNRPVRGQQVDELIGLPIAHLHHSQEHQQNLQQALAQLLVTGQSVSYESDEEYEGRRTWAVNRLGPIYQGNTISALILISTDITEQKEAEMAMLHSQKLESLGIMAGGVAHDFNNLLAAIVGQASLGVIKLERDSQSVEEHLHNILRAGQRATDLTRQMLNYAGRSVAEFQLLDLGQLLHENIHFFSASISKQIQIQGPQTSELPAITGDAGQVQQLVMNLILNAADAIGEGAGTITVSTRQYQLSLQEAHEWKLTGEQLAAGTYVMLEIADDGCGMDSDTLKKIFDPFFTTKFTGKGLGLASVIGIVRTHHGGLQVKSAPGIGTTFRILFPTPETLPNRTIPTIPVEPAIERSKVDSFHDSVLEREEDEPMFDEPFVSYAGKKVLIIDDERDVRQVTAEILQLSDIQTLEAPNGAKGVELFRQHKQEIDLVLLDLSMPGMSGEEVVRQLWTIQPAVQITLLSGYDQHEVARRLGVGNQLSFLQKPYTMDSLLKEIGRQFANVETSAALQLA